MSLSLSLSVAIMRYELAVMPACDVPLVVPLAPGCDVPLVVPEVEPAVLPVVPAVEPVEDPLPLVVPAVEPELLPDPEPLIVAFVSIQLSAEPLRQPVTVTEPDADVLC